MLLSTLLPKRQSVRWIVGANLVPLAGALLFGWSVSAPVMVYLVEAFLLGLPFAARIVLNRTPEVGIVEKVVYVPLCLVGYWAVVLGELGFCLITFYDPSHDGPTFLMGRPDQLGAAALAALREMGPASFAVSVAALFTVQLRHFVTHWLHGDGRQENFWLLIFKPFGRVFLLLFVVVPGGAFLYYRGTTTWFAVALALLKLATDLVTYRIAHAKTWAGELQAAPPAA